MLKKVWWVIKKITKLYFILDVISWCYLGISRICDEYSENDSVIDIDAAAFETASRSYVRWWNRWM